MSQKMLHIVAETRMGNTSVLVGDRAALNSLRHAIEDALATGSGGASVFSSDGEFHKVAIVLENDMYPVFTTYAFELAPERSRRETIAVDQLQNYSTAVEKAAAQALAVRPQQSYTSAQSVEGMNV